MMNHMERKLDKKYINATILKSVASSLIAVLVIGAIVVTPILSSAGGAALAGGLSVFAILMFFFIISIGITALRTVLFYRSFTYQLGQDAFTKKYGVLTRRTVVIPYNRVQNVDIVEPLWFRIFGLAQVNIQTAAGASNTLLAEGSLPGVSKADATYLHEEILRLALLSQQQPLQAQQQPLQAQQQPQQTPQQPPQDTGL